MVIYLLRKHVFDCEDTVSHWYTRCLAKLAEVDRDTVSHYGGRNSNPWARMYVHVTARIR